MTFKQFGLVVLISYAAPTIFLPSLPERAKEPTPTPSPSPANFGIDHSLAMPNACVSTGSSDEYVCRWRVGDCATFLAHSANSGAAMFDFGQGARPIVRNGKLLKSREILSRQWVTVCWTGSEWELKR